MYSLALADISIYASEECLAEQKERRELKEKQDKEAIGNNEHGQE